MKHIVEKVQQERKRLQKEVRERAISYIAAAFGLVAGLAWNDAIKAFIEYFFPLSKNTLFAKFFYAVFVTFIVVFVTVYLARLLTSSKDEEDT